MEGYSIYIGTASTLYRRRAKIITIIIALLCKQYKLLLIYYATYSPCTRPPLPSPVIRLHNNTYTYTQDINIYIIILFGGDSISSFFRLGLSMRFSELEFSVK